MLQFTQFLRILIPVMLLWQLKFHRAYANPVTQATRLDDELSALNMPTKINLNFDASDKNNTRDTFVFAHRDEDQRILNKSLYTEASLKYDVEILESRDIKKENIEIEERFRGPAIRMNTNTFTAENIEVNGDDDNDNIGTSSGQQVTITHMDGEPIISSHMVLTIILLVVAITSIGLYAALVLWRAHLEQRYGMRELLVTNGEDQSQYNSRNDINANSVYREISTSIRQSSNAMQSGNRPSHCES